jgi:hypothetical protein
MSKNLKRSGVDLQRMAKETGMGDGYIRAALKLKLTAEYVRDEHDADLFYRSNLKNRRQREKALELWLTLCTTASAAEVVLEEARETQSELRGRAQEKFYQLAREEILASGSKETTFLELCSKNRNLPLEMRRLAKKRHSLILSKKIKAARTINQIWSCLQFLGSQKPYLRRRLTNKIFRLVKKKLARTATPRAINDWWENSSISCSYEGPLRRPHQLIEQMVTGKIRDLHYRDLAQAKSIPEILTLYYQTENYRDIQRGAKHTLSQMVEKVQASGNLEKMKTAWRELSSDSASRELVRPLQIKLVKSMAAFFPKN